MCAAFVCDDGVVACVYAHVDRWRDYNRLLCVEVSLLCVSVVAWLFGVMRFDCGDADLH